jgi:hypothetical protein
MAFSSHFPLLVSLRTTPYIYVYSQGHWQREDRAQLSPIRKSRFAVCGQYVGYCTLVEGCFSVGPFGSVKSDENRSYCELLLSDSIVPPYVLAQAPSIIIRRGVDARWDVKGPVRNMIRGLVQKSCHIATSESAGGGRICDAEYAPL